MAPDGIHYTYPEYQPGPGPVTGRIHVVDAGSGSDRAINVPAPSTPIDYASDGIYVHRVVPNSGAPPQGLVLVDPAVSSYKQVSDDGKDWTSIGGGFAWGIDPPPSPSAPPKGNQVVRLDISGGNTTTYLQRADAGLQLLGLDWRATPVIGAYTNTNYLLLVGTTQVYSGALNDDRAPTGNVMVDNERFWISSRSGALWLYTASAGLHQVANVPMRDFRIAGSCH
jgi:hypothetical protein